MDIIEFRTCGSDTECSFDTEEMEELAEHDKCRDVLAGKFGSMSYNRLTMSNNSPRGQWL